MKGMKKDSAGYARFQGTRAAMAVLAGICAALVSRSAWATPFNLGDVFASVSNGLVQHYDGAGNLLETLDTGKGAGVFTTGCKVSGGNLHVTDFNGNDVTKFAGPGDPHTPSSFGSGYNCDPESILFDGSGNVYVGQAGCSDNILKFDGSGTPLASFAPAVESRGTDWIDLAADQCTMFYTSEGPSVKRFDVCANMQLADFATGLSGVAFALRLLPGGGLLVANSAQIVRLDALGSVIQTYDAAGEDSWFALNLDPDGTSFWSGDFGTGDYFKFNIASGMVELGPINTGTGGDTLFGLCVSGEITVAVTTTTTASTTTSTTTTTTTTTSTTTTSTTTSTTTTSTTSTTMPGTGYMTGGGTDRAKTNKTVTFNGGAQLGVTQGLLLHCRAATLPNNLQVNWPNNSFHLEQLVSATCSNDGTSPQPPPAGFDVLQGSGTGRCNGLAATANFKFVDHGEPGTNDTVEIHITGGCSLDVSGNLQGGNIQAHNGH